MDALIVFKIGSERVGVDIDKVREVAEAHAPVGVPGSPDFVEGLVNIRGEVIPVMSLRKRIGDPKENRQKRLEAQIEKAQAQLKELAAKTS